MVGYDKQHTLHYITLHYSNEGRFKAVVILGLERQVGEQALLPGLPT